MKQVIDGKLYDTETAECLGEGSANANKGDFRYFEEKLYRTSSGRHFLAGHGGPMTKYAEPAAGGGFGGGSRIIPLSSEEAQQWAERYLSVEDVLRLFEIEAA